MGFRCGGGFDQGASVQMFDRAVIVNVHPRVPGLGEARVGEITHGHRDNVRSRCKLPVHGRAARGAEMEGARAAAVSHARERCGVAVNSNIVTMKACLRPEHASGALLAGEAMAY
jgi:hypothetical protein